MRSRLIPIEGDLEASLRRAIGDIEGRALPAAKGFVVVMVGREGELEWWRIHLEPLEALGALAQAIQGGAGGHWHDVPEAPGDEGA